MARFRCPNHFFSELVKYLGKTSVDAFLVVVGAFSMETFGYSFNSGLFKWPLSIPTVLNNDWSS